MTARLKVCEKFRLDKYTEFFFGTKNGFNNSIFLDMQGIRQPPKGKKFADKAILRYTKEDLLEYYSVNRGDFKLDDTKKFIIDAKHELIFIPLANKVKNIVDYGVTELKFYDKIKPYSFHLIRQGNQKYIACTKGRLHNIIFGRKAKAGGWIKIENYIETEETLSAKWIESEEMPLPHVGKNWTYCMCKNGEVYIKLPGYVIDHINSDGLDNRFTNLREGPFGLNGANKSKRKGMTSNYFGVHRMNNKWVSNIIFNGIHYQRRFDDEKMAARFRDMYSLALYKQIICNNGFLTEEQTQDILKRGEAAIPEEYRATKQKQRPLPKYIMMDEDTFKVCRHYRNRAYHMRFKTLEEAVNSLPELNRVIQEAKDEYREQLVQAHIQNLYPTYGILNSYDKDGVVNGSAVVSPDVWKKFILINWTLSSNKRLSGMVNGVTSEIHIHAFRDQYPEYHKSLDGTVDHIVGDEDGVSDCRIENLRCASFNQQAQNTERKSPFGYKGIGSAYKKFYAIFCWQGKIQLGKRQEYLEDAARDYNTFVLEKWKDGKINIIPDTKTTIADFYHKSKLTLNQIENIETVREIVSIFCVNEDWFAEADITDLRRINQSMVEKYRNFIRKLYLQEEIEIDVDDEDEIEEEEFEEEQEEDDENEVEEIIDAQKFNKSKIVARPYIERPIDPEYDASKLNNFFYGYTKGFDRRKLVIKEDEAKIIRIIFAEVDKKVVRRVIAEKLNAMGYKKNGNDWTISTVRSVDVERGRFEGKPINGLRHPKII